VLDYQVLTAAPEGGCCKSLNINTLQHKKINRFFLAPSCFLSYLVYMKIIEFLKQIKVESLAVAKIKAELNKKSLTIVQINAIL